MNIIRNIIINIMITTDTSLLLQYVVISNKIIAHKISRIDNITDVINYSVHEAIDKNHIALLDWLRVQQLSIFAPDTVEFAVYHMQNDKISPSEIGSPLAVDCAALNGDVRIFTHLFDTSECSVYAMNWAARNGHINIVEDLYRWSINCNIEQAIINAEQGGHYEIAQWLRENREVYPSGRAHISSQYKKDRYSHLY